MVTGEECYKAMSELEQRRWQRNVIKHSDVPINYFMGKWYHNFCDFIKMSFGWGQTKEGIEYWSTVCEKYKLHDQLNPSPHFTTKPPKTF
tara:strand:- start:1293 stop:1562 length:270 start_codon:yes stop_codon:yes gene_type:complete